MKKYNVILADPPWMYKHGGNGPARNHYGLEQTDAIAKLPILSLSNPDSVLVLWATWPFLTDAFRVIEAWGFQYVTGMPWIKLQEQPWQDLWGDEHIKPTYGTGFWLRGCSEPILICKRGKAKPPKTNAVGLISERMEHSRKPDDIYEYCEGMPGPYLELFARRRREGWDAFGNEVEGSIELGVPV